jgi:hypothetical protein
MSLSRSVADNLKIVALLTGSFIVGMGLSGALMRSRIVIEPPPSASGPASPGLAGEAPVAPEPRISPSST